MNYYFLICYSLIMYIFFVCVLINFVIVLCVLVVRALFSVVFLSSGRMYSMKTLMNVFVFFSNLFEFVLDVYIVYIVDMLLCFMKLCWEFWLLVMMMSNNLRIFILFFWFFVSSSKRVNSDFIFFLINFLCIFEMNR